jgi:hypothetical protein
VAEAARSAEVAALWSVEEAVAVAELSSAMEEAAAVVAKCSLKARAR